MVLVSTPAGGCVSILASAQVTIMGSLSGAESSLEREGCSEPLALLSTSSKWSPLRVAFSLAPVTALGEVRTCLKTTLQIVIIFRDAEKWGQSVRRLSVSRVTL